MRRIAFVVLATFAASAFLFTGMAWAPTTTSITVVNESRYPADVVIFPPPPPLPSSFQHYRLLSTLDHKINPHRSFHASRIERESCVLLRVAHDRGDRNAPCRDNHTPLDVRCDVSSHYSCEVHRGGGEDVVVKLVPRGA